MSLPGATTDLQSYSGNKDENDVDLKKEEAEEIVAKARQSFNDDVTRSYYFRKRQLNGILRLYKENMKDIFEALKTDLHKSKQETMISEVGFVLTEVNELLENLQSWMQPQKAKKGLLNILNKLEIIAEPYGVVLVMGAWNYPIHLSILPLAAAIASGNCVIVKPSEVTKASAKLLKRLVPKYLDNECYYVYEGDAVATKLLLMNRFDYIFFTGSTNVARVIHESANRHLTPVTLELGGKSPVYIDETADIYVSAKRVLWGKCMNGGQTCIAPDYVLCSSQVEENFVMAAKHILRKWYSEDVQRSPDFCRIVDDKNFVRVSKLLEGANVVLGGHCDAVERFIEPTIVSGVNLDDELMQSEIFGPILPIVTVNNVEHAIAVINKGEKPLALYVFSKSEDIVKLMVDRTSSGGVTVNDTMMHFAVETLPFGGVGYSGMGAYHGKYNFDTFSHHKSCMWKDFGVLNESLTKLRYPPYSDLKTVLLNLVLGLKLPKWLTISSNSLFFISGFLIVLLLQFCYNFLSAQ